MAQEQSQRKTTHNSTIEVANAGAANHPLITHAVATSCRLYAFTQDEC